MVAAYTNALNDLPPWAVNEAARRWTRGMVVGGNPAFPPSSAELHAVSRTVVAAYRFEAAMLERMLVGKVQNEPVHKLSRARKLEIESQTRHKLADEALKARAAALGMDPDQTLKDIENQKQNDAGFDRLKVSVPA